MMNYDRKLVELSCISVNINNKEILSDITLTVMSGEFIVIVGSSGSGKTTLLRVIAGLAEPVSGGVYWSTPDKVKKLGIVSQSPTLLPWLTVYNNVALPCRRQSMSKNDVDFLVSEKLSEVGLLARSDEAPKNLSGGMQQRVSVARALVTSPDILLMDEPFSALDEKMRDEMVNLLVELWYKEKITVVLVTHSIEEALILGTKIVSLKSNPGSIIGEYSTGWCLSVHSSSEVRKRAVYNEMKFSFIKADIVKNLSIN